MKRFAAAAGSVLCVAALAAPAQAEPRRPTVRQAWDITGKTVRAHHLDAKREGCVTYGKRGRGCFYTYSEGADEDLVVGAVIVRLRHRRFQCHDDWHRDWHRCPG